MQGGFWNNNPCAPNWSSALAAWWSKKPPSLLQVQPYRVPCIPVSGCELRRGVIGDASAISEFWSRWFAVTPSCRCLLPANFIAESISSGRWELYLVLDSSTGCIVGTGVRRWLTNLTFRYENTKEVIWNKAAMIDYFCCAPAWRSKGVGRWILATLQNTGPVPLPPHLILWEGLHPTIPPVSTGFFYAIRSFVKTKEDIQEIKESHERQTAWNTLLEQNKPDLFTKTGSFEEVSLWRVKDGFLAIWNTFHRSIPDGAKIGVLIMASSGKTIDRFVESSQNPFGVLLATETKDSELTWTIDSPYQWIVYNLCCPFFMGSFPCLSL